MKPYWILTSAAALSLLSVAGCNRNPDAGSGEEAASPAAEDTGLAPSEDASDQADTTEAPAAAPAVAEVPVPADTKSAEAAPLVQAAAVAKTISEASDVERVPYDGGWAWRRNGQIIRTASRDGRRISYFRAGEAAPFLVQEGDRSYAYSAGRMQRGYDGRGRPVEVDQSHRRESEQLVRQSSDDHRQAARSASERPDRIERGRPGRSGATPDARPGSRHDAAPGDRREAGANGREASPGNTPSPAPKETGRSPHSDAPEARNRDRDGSHGERPRGRPDTARNPSNTQPASE